MSTLLRLLILLLPWAMWPTHFQGFWLPKTVAWAAASLLLVSLGLSQGLPLRLPKWGAWLLGWISLRFAYQFLWPLVTVASTVERKAALPFTPWPILPFVLAWGSLMVYGLLREIKSQSWWQQIAYWCCVSTSLVMCYALGQALHLDPFQFEEEVRVGGYSTTWNLSGTWGNPMLLAHHLAIGAPLFLIFRPWYFKLSYALCLLVIAVTYSASALGAALLGSLVVWGLQQRYKTFLSMIALMGLGFGYLWWLPNTQQYFSFSYRLELWQHVLSVWRQYPLLAWIGHGLGATSRLTTTGFWNYGMLHNELLQVLFELGVVGAVLLLGWLVTEIKVAWQAPKSVLLTGWLGSLTSYGLISLVGFPWRIGTSMLLGVLILAAVHALNGGGDGES